MQEKGLHLYRNEDSSDCFRFSKFQEVSKCHKLATVLGCRVPNKISFEETLDLC